MSSQAQTTKMNPAVKQLWIEALRSGAYTQGYCRLRTQGDEYCCLGVLCDLAVQRGIIPPPILDQQEGEYSFEEHTGSLPDKVMAWAGLTSSIGEYCHNGHFKKLIHHNDVHEFSFATIANIIEEHF